MFKIGHWSTVEPVVPNVLDRDYLALGDAKFSFSQRER